ncbi:mechanosensitive ion channel [Alteromonas sp. ASW11-19]|uniref:Small-conductance mechanosensitive channel n=1 Tax=Alteromonas salexigens TaxID=2982530 RepID=A0ABT2VJ44_9ALTE|nr:mechanosensitive ion channel domain-containing protein [Alteromonas salexigens]MCU7553225.1 mechanosensitive ion channel [Alteromonas salexigens]
MTDDALTLITAFYPLVAAIAGAALILGLSHYLLIGRHEFLSGDKKLPRQATMLVLTLVALLVIVLSLPVPESTRNQIIALIGVLLSGVIAFSSTTVVTNIMSGLTLRVNKPFRVGDFIRVNGFTGRVTQMGLLDTEIQNETRELIAFSNSQLVNSPVSVVRASGAIISVDLSLGYELHHSTVETHLLEAAARCELQEPFVQVITLGDYSVTYRIAGLLTEVKSMISARSNLHKAVMDSLHENGIEIVSPAFMNQRPQAEGVQMIPAGRQQAESQPRPASAPEDILFDKAEEAESELKSREAMEKQLAQLKEQLANASGEQKDKLEMRIDKLAERLAASEASQQDASS